MKGYQIVWDAAVGIDWRREMRFAWEEARREGMKDRERRVAV